MRKQSINHAAIQNAHGIEKKHFELHHGRKQRTELKNVIEDGESFLSEWSKLSVSVESKSKIPIYVSRNSDGDYI